MAGPLTTEARVRALGQLYDSAALNFFAHNLFGLVDAAALSTRIGSEITLASAWLQSRGGADYASGDAIKDALFAEAEAYLALQSLYESLKMRRVLGIHFPYVQEGSERFEALIDVEMPAHIQQFVDAYLAAPESPDKPWAAPAMARSRPIDRTQSGFKDQRAQLDADIDEATGLPVVVFPLTTDGEHNQL